MFSYDPENLDLPLNKARFLIQDTDPLNPLLQDSEIECETEDETNIYRAAASLCRVLAAKFAQEANIEDESVKIKRESAAGTYRLLAKDLDSKADRRDLIAPAAGGGEGGGLNLPTYYPGQSIFTRDLHSK